ncbi:probable peptidyl-tRNA hydrolase 2 [Hyalella azteca]|uniref:peptidyl-tRNA hydrolase n=1 Tax=Hyalella azteca TaxID=294128 RepID=A0A8B7N3V1_HYAAZ|nr:probable peptidyl-tRNA hydrolase 2 [Hyalella azteca]
MQDSSGADRLMEPVNERSALDTDDASAASGDHAAGGRLDADGDAAAVDVAAAADRNAVAGVGSSETEPSPSEEKATATAASSPRPKDGTTSNDLLCASSDAATSEEVGSSEASNIESSSGATINASVGSPKQPTNTHGADAGLLAQLLEMGVPATLAIRALVYSGNGSVEAAFTWLAQLSAEEADALSLLPLDEDGQDWEDVDDEDDRDVFSHKMALVVDTSLRMKPGKMAAQVGHAVLGLHRALQRAAPRTRASDLTKWEMTGEKMVVLRGSDSSQLRLLKKKAEAARLPTYLVADAGLTQIAEGSVTVLGIFGSCAAVDEITGGLKLL